MRVRTVIAALLLGASSLASVAGAPTPAAAAPTIPTTVQTVVGFDNTCALSSTGGVKCWGRNNIGQLGDGTHVDRPLPADVVGLRSGVVALAGGGRTCALLTSGAVTCWPGRNGQFNPLPVPVPMNYPAPVLALPSSGSGCAVLTDRSVACEGLLGGVSAQADPVRVAGLGPVAEVVVGGGHACARTVTGAALCWGQNTHGQLGDGTTTDRPEPTPVSGLASGVTGIAAGQANSCATITGGALRCWGANGAGQVGDGTMTGNDAPASRLTPVDVVGLGSGVEEVSIGLGLSAAVLVLCVGSSCPPGGSIVIQTMLSHVCARTTAGAVLCWGEGGQGQLGDGIASGSRTPQVVLGLEQGVTDLSGGLGFHGCAVVAGAPQCWGRNGEGQLGTGVVGSRYWAPEPVADLPSASSVSAGSAHTCAVTTAAAAWCWGNDQYGQLGDGSAGGPEGASQGPGSVSGLGSGVVGVSAGAGTSCALLTGGAVRCWGNNMSGQLGDGTTTDRSTPTEVVGLGGPAIQVASGSTFGCALLASGTVRCWGSGASGQLGNGTTADHSVPADVVGLPANVASIALRSGGACARTTAGAVWCWGSNFGGQVGDGTTTARLVPTPVVGLASGVVELAAGGSHACARTAAGGAVCWGYNGRGQLGDGSTIDRTTPVAVSGLASGVGHLGAGAEHTCARLEDGSARCWGGSNAEGELGNRTLTASTTPVPVVGGAGIQQLSAGSQHTCTVAAAGAVACWGRNQSRQLGPAAVVRSSLPVPVALTWGPQDVPGAPAIGSATSGNGSATLTWTAPTTDGGSDVSGYVVTPYVGATAQPARTFDATATTRTVTGLTNGTTYTFRVAATNGTGTGAPSGPSGAVTPAPTVPGAPTIGSAVAGNTSATVSWTAPSTDGGSPVTGYVVTPYLGGVAQAPRTFDASATTRTITGLVNRTTYLFRVSATNVVGTGATSAESNRVTPEGTIPSVPTAVSAVAGNASASVSWTAPATDGGEPIRGYVVTPYVGGVAQPAQHTGSRATTHTVTGLTNGTTYTFRVAAENVLGTGAPSAGSNAVTPAVPAAPYAPFASWSALVTRLHVDLTTKAPSSAALSSWVAQLSSGSKTKGDLADALRRGSENLANVDPVVRVYRAFLGRAPDAGGLQFWIKRKRNVKPAKTWSVTQIATDFTGSSEFKTKYGSLTNRQFVTRIYTDVLGRPADPSGVNYWTGKLDRRERTKAQVMVGFSESSEYQTKQAENTDVAVAYVYLLGRAPTAAEASAWVARQRAGTSHATLLGELLASPAYATRVTG